MKNHEKEISSNKNILDKLNIRLNKQELKLKKLKSKNDLTRLEKLTQLEEYFFNSSYKYTWKEASKDIELKNINDYLRPYMIDESLEYEFRNFIYSLMSQYSDIRVIHQKIVSTQNILKSLKKEQEEYNNSLTEKDKQLIKEKNKSNDLRLYLKKELPNIKIKSLDSWLANYRKLYTSWVDSEFKKGNISETKRKKYKDETESVVTNQKLDIVLKSWEKVGKIKDIKFGTLGSDGSFNGIVIGEKGKIKIETILAGGYNIQILHYRVLIKELTLNKNKLDSKIVDILNKGIIEVNKSYIKDIPFLVDIQEPITKLSPLEFINLRNKSKDNLIVVSSVSSLPKSKKLELIRKLEIVDSNIIILNSGDSLLKNKPNLNIKHFDF